MAKPDPVKEEDMGEEQEGEFDHDLDQDSGSGPGDDDGTGESKPSAPMQKRRRVTRACDECRRKKIKCDGKQPCTHCTVYSYGMSASSCAASPATDNPLQNVHTTSPRIGAAIPSRPTSKPSRPGSTLQRGSFA